MIVFLQKRADSTHVGEKIYFDDGWYEILDISNYMQDEIPITEFKLVNDNFFTITSHAIVDIQKFSLKRTLMQL